MVGMQGLRPKMYDIKSQFSMTFFKTSGYIVLFSVWLPPIISPLPE